MTEMHKVFYSSASPYSAKVRMAAAYVDLPLDEVVVDIASSPREVIDANPLGKIPVLTTDSGQPIYDSRAIIQYLDRISGGGLFPHDAEGRTQAERLEALADGICDCLLAHVYERRNRPEDRVYQPWLDRQWTKALRALDLLNGQPPNLVEKTNAGHIALRTALGYLALRFSGQWEEGRNGLTGWVGAFDRKHPELLPFIPR